MFENIEQDRCPKILLMEDDIELVTLLKESMDPLGALVTEVTNGFEAMEAFKSQKFDLIITDIMVKGLNGFQLIDFILKKGGRIPIVVITGAYPNGFDQYAQTLGIKAYFEKPFDLEEFSRVIQKILDDTLYQGKVAIS